MRELPVGMRDKLLLAAGLLAERGLDSTKIEDIAGATGIPKATLYYYFDGKEDILRFLFSEILGKLNAAIHSAVSADTDAASRLRAAIAAHLDVFVSFPAASLALQRDLGRAARMPEIVSQSRAAFIKPVHDLLLEGALDGSLRKVDEPWVVATAILGAVTATGINFFVTPDPRLRKVRAAELSEFLLAGVSPKAK